ncbi:NAD-dependent protein deacetylase of SIR2 family protein [Enhygromyxa salina]|uniref:protein acetyllysine N-acetyltransferase n=1 Tax=Enhygromyxa salina TaxID=215803 RepID=A0A0C1ZRT3_9BACT|nr:Sir2 family NAD-dependent protein deacetylase [Enhygromyxa salina]KIG13778.1 NAD-dependent protein deacetylase of SIR2 family protein [Enhygromyxa salina]
MAAAPKIPTNDSERAAELDALLSRIRPERVVVVTGAGISAESGIPTFRGPEGYWTVGSQEYHPEDMATQVAFSNMPREVWRWYLYRKAVCNQAAPNVAHLALAKLEQALGDRFMLVTQNVDGLHLRAGSTHARTIQVHGSTDLMRAIEGDDTPIPIPASMPILGRNDPISDEAWELLTTPDGRRTRPHILWFDECYNERLYRAESALTAAKSCDLLVVVGTSGAAAIPYHVAAVALRRGVGIIDINPEPNPFSEHALDQAKRGSGLWLQGTGSQWVPELVARLT